MRIHIYVVFCLFALANNCVIRNGPFTLLLLTHTSTLPCLVYLQFYQVGN